MKAFNVTMRLGTLRILIDVMDKILSELLGMLSAEENINKGNWKEDMNHKKPNKCLGKGKGRGHAKSKHTTIRALKSYVMW